MPMPYALRSGEFIKLGYMLHWPGCMEQHQLPSHRQLLPPTVKRQKTPSTNAWDSEENNDKLDGKFEKT